MSEETTSKPESKAAYNPAEAEAFWYEEWQRRGYFKGDPASAKNPYVIVIPPPNVTGILTLGHVLNNTLQDVLIRFEKMRGRETCWVPGTDHAGIATQARVEHMLKEKEKLTRHDLGREKFLERVWQWKNQYGGTIVQQLRRLGVACDWERERFTLDQGLSDAVQEVFIRLHKKGLIYKGHRIINWCPKSGTALSNEEVNYKETRGSLWHFRYPLKDGSGHIVVATTRPETMLGDTAVAVNPKDERYAALIGKLIVLPLVGREIPIIADEFVDPAFGTGAVKVTPAHDPNDYEMGLRHKLPMINVMNDDASMNEDAGAEFQGLDRNVCRKKIVKMMDAAGLLEKIEEHTHQVGFSERGDVPVEPRLSEQWFVKMKPLAEPALAAVEDGRIKFHPERWTKTYRHWMENINDWCISRQLWWGHRIPAYYCQAEGCGEIVVDKATPAKCPKCGGSCFKQDEDVLDTWFSSWLWPFSVMGWPEQTAELKKFYPTATLVTGPDIIFFWVARMIMSGLEFMGEVPFKDVYFTSIIRDDKGRKLSKSLNNSPDPLDVMAQYGTDALRFTIIYIAPVGQDIRYANEKCEIGRNFATKLWNVAKFRQRFGDLTAEWASLDTLAAKDLFPHDRWILARLDAITSGTTKALDNFDFHQYAHDIYEFVWNEFCDWYLESAKAVLNAGDDAAKARTLHVFDHVFGMILRLVQPLMPFITEEVAHSFGFVTKDDSLMLAPWPKPFADSARERLGATPAMAALVQGKFAMLSGGRNVRANYKIAQSTKISAIIVPTDDQYRQLIVDDSVSFSALLNAEIKIIDASEWQSMSSTSPATSAVVSDAGTMYIPLAGLIDSVAEVAKLKKQKEAIIKARDGYKNNLAKDSFVANAPPAVVEMTKIKLADSEAMLVRVNEQIKALE